jgi:hypothetical protein
MEMELLLAFAGVYLTLALLVYKTFRIECKIKEAAKTQKYEPSITLWKFLKQFIFGVISFVAVESISNYVVSLNTFNSSALIVFFIAAFNAFLNFVKNR